MQAPTVRGVRFDAALLRSGHPYLAVSSISFASQVNLEML